MLKRLTLLSAVGILCLAGTANSQTKKDSSATSSTVIIFNSGPAIAKGSSGENNVIKLAPLGFISGKIPVSYERRISDLLSIQLTGGVTSKNYTNAWWFNRMSDFSEREVKYENFPLPGNVDDATDRIFDYTNRKAPLGYMFSVQPRLYFDNEGLEGPFIGLSADFYNYKFEIPGWKNNGGNFEHTGETKKEYEKIQDIMVSYGVQKLYDHLSVEYSVAAGLRKINGVKYVAGSEYNSQQVYEGSAKYTKSGLNLGVSLKIGYHF